MGSPTISPVRQASPGGAMETTTARTALLRQIRVLQKLEQGLSEQVAALAGDPSPEAAQQRVALQQQIQSIEDQIKMLQTAMLQKDADRQVQIPKDAETESTKSDTAKSDSSDAKPASKAAAAPPTETIGSVIDTVA
jgi:TolA-binding protein